MRSMYDSTTAADLPGDAGMVAGYVDGLYRWSDADWGRFPHAVKVRIAVFATTDDGHVLDVEKGNATPAQAPGWVAMRRRAGVDPTVYCARSAWATLQAAFSTARVAAPHWWVADWTGSPHLPAGAVACQWADSVLTGHHYDTSEVADYWPGVDPRPPAPAPPRPPAPVPAPAPAPARRKEPLMIIVEVDTRTVPKGEPWPGVFCWNGTTLAHVAAAPDDANMINLLRALGQPSAAPITWEQWKAWSGA